MSQETSEKRSVSFPADLLAASLEVSNEQHRSFSSFVCFCLGAELERLGRLPHQRTEADEAIERAKAAIEEVGGGVLIDAIDRLLDERAEKEVPA